MNYRWLLAALLFGGMALSYLDRTAISVAAPLMAKDLHLSPSQTGMVFSIFFVGYALTALIGGYAADHISTRWMYGMTMAVWTLFCGLTALATGFTSLLIIRLIFGLGEGPGPTLNNRAVNDWFPKREQAGAIGIINGGAPLGSAIAGPLVGMVAEAHGWQLSFVLLAGISAVWLVACVLVIRDKPQPEKTASPSEGVLAPANEVLPSILDCLRMSTTWATGVAFFGYMYINFFFLTWFPSYLTMAHKVSIQNMGFATSLLWSAGFLGIVLGGFVSNAFYRRMGNAVRARKMILVPCLFGSGLCATIAGFVHDVTGAVALTVAATFLLKATTTCYWVLVLDTVPRGRVGAITGILHATSILSGIIGPAVTGLMVEETGSFGAAFLLAGSLGIGGALVAAAFIKPDRTPEIGILEASGAEAG